jgi:ABC-2 type transport system ATP-binding protein
VLAIKGLVVKYRDREVLRGLDLSLPKGSIYGLLGPNGAGKTTLIRTICGRITPRAGTIAIDGEPNTNRRTLRRIGLVPQEIGLYPHLTVRENLLAFGRLSGLGHRATHEAMRWAADATRIAARLDERIDILSGGWKRRVNIAAAILHHPALLILDEPTVGVDVDARNELHEVILDLSQNGMSVLLTTHDLDQAETLCSTVGFLQNGLIAPQGSPRALISEAFAAQKEIVLELRRALDAPQRKALTGAGFTGTNADMSWTMIGHVDEHTATGLAQRFEAVGVMVREVRYREPGLDSLFVHLAQGKHRAP